MPVLGSPTRPITDMDIARARDILSLPHTGGVIADRAPFDGDRGRRLAKDLGIFNAKGFLPTGDDLIREVIARNEHRDMAAPDWVVGERPEKDPPPPKLGPQEVYDLERSFTHISALKVERAAKEHMAKHGRFANALVVHPSMTTQPWRRGEEADVPSIRLTIDRVSVDVHVAKRQAALSMGNRNEQSITSTVVRWAHRKAEREGHTRLTAIPHAVSIGDANGIDPLATEWLVKVDIAVILEGQWYGLPPTTSDWANRLPGQTVRCWYPPENHRA